MAYSCLTGLVSIINEQTTRTADVLYVNDLPDISFKDMTNISKKVTGDLASGSAIVTNLSLNTSNMSVGESVKGEGIQNGTTILNILTASSITLSKNVLCSCKNVELIIDSAGTYLFNNILELAKKQLESDILTHFQGCLAVESVLENDILGYYKDYDSNIIIPAANYYRGQQIIIDRYPYLEFYVHRIRLFLNTAVTSTIDVWDLIQKKKIDTISFTSVANEITDVTVNKSYKTNRQRLNLAFVYDGSLSGSYKTTSSKRSSGCVKCGYRNNYLFENGIQIPKTSQIIESNLSKTGECYGMSLTYSLNCSIEPFICSIRNLFQFPLLYLVASMILKEALHNQRINSYITIQKQDHAILAKQYEDEYKMQLFGAFNEAGIRIKQGLLDRITLPNDMCFRKRNKIKIVSEIP